MRPLPTIFHLLDLLLGRQVLARLRGFTLVSSTGVDHFFAAAAFFLGVVDFS
jgi:hypothetical protein